MIVVYCVFLHPLVETAGDNFQLMLTAQLDEIDSITRDTDGELGIFLRMFHRVFQHFAVQHVHVQVVRSLYEITVHHRYQVLNTCLTVYAQRFRDDGERVADAVLRVAVAQLGNRAE